MRTRYHFGKFHGGRVWIEDENGQATALLETKSGPKPRGTWVDMHDKPVSFNARKYHMLEKLAETCGSCRVASQAYKHACESHVTQLMELGFPVPPL